jgi:hypothetical protein
MGVNGQSHALAALPQSPLDRRLGGLEKRKTTCPYWE